MPHRPLARTTLATLLLVACGGEPPPERTEAGRDQPREPGQELGPQMEVADPRPRVTSVVKAEVLSESVTNWLGSVADKVFVRDFDGLAASLAPDFHGHDPFGVDLGEPRETALGTRRFAVDAGRAAAVDGRRWLASLEERIGPWQRLELVHWSLSRAEFQITDELTWGAASLGLHVVGITDLGGRESIHAAFRARLELAQGTWKLQRLQLLELEVARKDAPVFADVTRPAGLFHEGVRFGQPGNDSDGWNGAACGDADGDGRWDVFVPSSLQSFLYVNRGDGTFAEQARERGLEADAGGTGALFLDADNDGDQDLFVGHVGWRSVGGEPRGAPLRFYRNDGGSFEDASTAVGLDLYCPASSLAAFDYDGDGWTDLFVCGYGRMDEETNDSWIEAQNGAPNTLLRNVEGRRFEDVTKAAGLADRRWSYAAAAADVDRDGDQDLYVANNFGSNRLWRNRGDGTFEDAAAELGVAAAGLTMGARWADLDNDGVLDLFLTRPSSHTGHRVLERLRERRSLGPLAALDRLASGNLLLRRGLDGRYRAAEDGFGAGHAGWAWGTACADFDLDGALDVFCVNGFVTGDLPQDT